MKGKIFIILSLFFILLEGCGGGETKLKYSTVVIDFPHIENDKIFHGFKSFADLPVDRSLLRGIGIEIISGGKVVKKISLGEYGHEVTIQLERGKNYLFKAYAWFDTHDPWSPYAVAKGEVNKKLEKIVENVDIALNKLLPRVEVKIASGDVIFPRVAFISEFLQVSTPFIQTVLPGESLSKYVPDRFYLPEGFPVKVVAISPDGKRISKSDLIPVEGSLIELTSWEPNELSNSYLGELEGNVVKNGKPVPLGFVLAFAPSVGPKEYMDIINGFSSVSYDPGRLAIGFIENGHYSIPLLLPGSYSVVAVSFPEDVNSLKEGFEQFYKDPDLMGKTYNLDFNFAEVSSNLIVKNFDVSPPDTFIVSYPPKVTLPGKIHFQFKSTEDNCTFRYSIDGEKWEWAQGSSLSLTLYKPGWYTIQVYAVDEDLNVDLSPAEYSWEVTSNFVPETYILSGPPPITSATIATFYFKSSITGSNFVCKLDGDQVPCYGNSATISDLDEGPHKFSVAAVYNDVTDPTPAIYKWDVDLTPPIVTIESYPPSITNASHIEIYFSSDETDVTFYCSVNEDPFAKCSSPLEMDGNEGDYTVRIYAIDRAGNKSKIESVSFTIDHTPPYIEITSYPEKLTDSPYAKFAIYGDDNGNILYKFECKLDEGAWESCSSPVIYENLSPGRHIFKVMVSDEAGNISQAEYSWSIVIWKAVSAGYQHTCAVKSDGSLWCWGFNEYGEIGTTPTEIDFGSPVSVSVPYARGKWIRVSTGENYSCGLVDNGTLWCWGNDDYGQLGSGGGKSSISPVLVAGAYSWSYVTCGKNFTCGITDDGKGYCWGWNNEGELGAEITDQYSLFPVEITGSHKWKMISAGKRHACGIDNNSKLWCWGDNSLYQLGVTGISETYYPIEVSASMNWIDVSAFGNRTCAIAQNGSLWCWGEEVYGLYDPGYFYSEVAYVKGDLPHQIGSDTDWLHIEVGDTFNCGLKTDDSLWCWGGDYFGVFMDNSQQVVEVPVQISENVQWATISASEGFQCGIDIAGELTCWGKNNHGQLGRGTSGSSPYPVHSGDYKWSFISGGYNFVVGKKANTTTISGWGKNFDYELGNVLYVMSRFAGEVTFEADYSAISAGYNHTCGIGSSGILKCWGNNDSGELGRGNSGESDYSPEPVTGGDSWSKVAAGAGYTCGIKKTGVVACWGYNSYSQLGNQNTKEMHSPVSVMSNVVDIGVSIYPGNPRTCAISSVGALYCWGRNDSGSLIYRGSNPITMPTEVTGVTGVSQISIGGSHQCIVDTNNNLYCWGGNWLGQTGTGLNYGIITYPIKVIHPEGGKWVKVAAGGKHTCAIDSNGALYCWGDNSYGQLGIGHYGGDVTMPIKVNGVSAVDLVAGPSYTCVVDSSSMLLCWGENKWGELGLKDDWIENLLWLRAVTSGGGPT